MNKYLIRIFDKYIKTNYIERIIEAEDELSAIDKLGKYDWTLHEIKEKFVKETDFDKLIDDNSFEIVKL